MALGSMANSADYRAAAGKTTITPSVPIWAGGYSARSEPVSEKMHDLYARVLVLEDNQGGQILFLTAEVENIPLAFAESVAGRLRQKHGIGRERIAICCSHTHCGPALLGPETEIVYPMTHEDLAATQRYTRWLEDRLVELATDALGRLAPANLAHGFGSATFAVNRRNNREDEAGKIGFNADGPVDHDVPVLRVTALDGSLRAILFGYACHCTTMNFQKWCGDYAGFAQATIESAHPGTSALFLAGCGADINPLPRRRIELCRQYGRELAHGVEKVLKTPMKPIQGPLRAGLSRVDLAFETLPSLGQLEEQRREGNRHERKRAEVLLKAAHSGQPLSPTYPYAVQIFTLGESLIAVVLAGEVVVDYSHRLKQELGPERSFVFAYANDLCAYIPSERVLAEGGYEGGDAMVYYGRPAPWAPGLEDRIVSTVHRLVGQLRPPH